MDVLKSFENEKRIVLEKLDFLHESIQNLHYEGKISLQKNVKNIEKTVQYLKELLMEHMKLDEEVIFPFASKQIPILDPMINFLKAERNEFNANLASFEILFQEFIAENNLSINHMLLEKLREKGTYVVCIVRNHVQTESEGIYKVLDQRLHLAEKKELYQLISKHMKSDSRLLGIK